MELCALRGCAARLMVLSLCPVYTLRTQSPSPPPPTSPSPMMSQYLGSDDDSLSSDIPPSSLHSASRRHRSVQIVHRAFRRTALGRRRTFTPMPLGWHASSQAPCRNSCSRPLIGSYVKRRTLAKHRNMHAVSVKSCLTNSKASIVITWNSCARRV